jgi:beta-N-acetylhexosaminidase
MKVERLLSVYLLAVLAFSVIAPISTGATGTLQTDLPVEHASALLDKLTPEEKVGQLILVDFTGSIIDEQSQIYDLIVHQHIGGVALLASNDNFAAAPDTVSEAYRLISQLQAIEWQASQEPSISTPGGDQIKSTYIPLFIATSQEGDGYPNDQILYGLTPLPDLMSIGATWQPSLAGQVGAVAGQELSALGFNLYLGPSLDVLESPGALAGGGLGARVFGGDPYWVGEMGKAYITGLHTGSNGRMLVIAKHFPGRGSSDRPASQEVATIRKSLEQLKQIELAPFFVVTGNAPDPQSTADGLLVSHIRYQGFQGNIRATTRPVSFDSQALSQILLLPAFAAWRASEGLMVSDDLGSQAVRLFYDPGGQSFSARLVARDALLAGNDLLYMGNIVSSDAQDNYSTILRILEFFTQKYREDAAFAQRVDDAVMRILVAKYRVYDNFEPTMVTPPAEGLDALAASQAVTFEVARLSATLINPDVQDLGTVLPAPPDIQDYILFLTDTRPGRQCSTCPEEPMMADDALQNVILRLYGPQAGGQVNDAHLTSYTFDDMASVLEGDSGNPALVSHLEVADWVVISILEADPSQTQAIVLRRFLSERQDLLRNKDVVVFAFNAPYYLDATDISKVTAYYGLYSKSASFVEVAALLLFQELTPAGALPVSVPGIGYDLLSATAPDPGQVIQLYLDLPPVPAPTATPTGTPEPTATPYFRVGDTVTVRTGVILDHNQHPVPDNTGVRFSLIQSGEGGVLQQVDATTVSGVARASFSIERAGLLEIHAASDPAANSVVLQLDITSEGVSVTVVAPTSTAEPASPTPEITPTSEETSLSPISKGYPGFGGWVTMVIFLGGLAYLALWLGGRLFSTRWGLRWAFCAILGGLLSYNYLALGLPGSAVWIKASGLAGILGVVILGAALGFAGGWLWAKAVSAPVKRSD